jgi:hypothetical protein
MLDKKPDMIRCHVYLTREQCEWIELRGGGVRSKSSIVREVLNRVMEMMPMPTKKPPEGGH